MKGIRKEMLRQKSQIDSLLAALKQKTEEDKQYQKQNGKTISGDVVKRTRTEQKKAIQKLSHQRKTKESFNLDDLLNDI